MSTTNASPTLVSIPELTQRQANAFCWLLLRIANWTPARWDQHLRNEVGDEDTNAIKTAVRRIFGDPAEVGNRANSARCSGPEDWSRMATSDALYTLSEDRKRLQAEVAELTQKLSAMKTLCLEQAGHINTLLKDRLTATPAGPRPGEICVDCIQAACRRRAYKPTGCFSKQTRPVRIPHEIDGAISVAIRIGKMVFGPTWDSPMSWQAAGDLLVEKIGSWRDAAEKHWGEFEAEPKGMKALIFSVRNLLESNGYTVPPDQSPRIVLEDIINQKKRLEAALQEAEAHAYVLPPPIVDIIEGARIHTAVHGNCECKMCGALRAWERHSEMHNVRWLNAKLYTFGIGDMAAYTTEQAFGNLPPTIDCVISWLDAPPPVESPK